MTKALLWILLVVNFGCGTKKRLVHVSASKENVSLTQNNDITANLKTVKQNNTTIYSPIDKTLPMTLPDGRTAINTKIIETDIKTNEDLNVFDKSKIEVETTTQKKDKEIDLDVKKSNPYLWIFLAGCAFAFIFYIYKYITGSFNPRI